jgi:hypothetical protein
MATATTTTPLLTDLACTIITLCLVAIVSNVDARSFKQIETWDGSEVMDHLEYLWTMGNRRTITLVTSRRE